MFALIDVDNFFVSCERVFHPELATRPVLVLSSNDGCVVARSNEVKQLGIPMGTPYFKIKNDLTRNHVAIFSSNFSLYQELSKRLMNLIGENFLDFEIYSIDECFLNLKQYQNTDLEGKLIDFREKIWRFLGLPVSIGLASTKTLAKLVGEIAKKEHSHFFSLEEDEFTKLVILNEKKLQEVWGLGKASVKKLNSEKIFTVNDFISCNQNYIKRLLGLGGEKIWYELKGIPRLERLPEKATSLQVTRSFGQKITDLTTLENILAGFVQLAAQKLRQKKSLTRSMGIYLRTSQYVNNENQRYGGYETCNLPQATNSELAILPIAHKLLRLIYQPGFSYQKLGLVLQNNLKEGEWQPNLFFSASNQEKETKLLEKIDQLNERFGSKTIQLATVNNLLPNWKPAATWKSPNYLNNWQELPVAK